MARARNIKPGFFTNDDLARCEYGARLLFVGLWTVADRAGRLEDRPLRLKALLFPFDNAKVDAWLAQLAEHRFITRYEAAGCKYIQVNNFQKHQNCHVKEPESTIPAPDLSGVGLGNSQDAVINKRESVRGNQESGNQSGKSGAGTRFEPPTVEDVRAYCQERSNAVDAEKFVAFYAAKGWMIGRNKMKDWRQAVITWEKNSANAPAGNGKPTAISGI